MNQKNILGIVFILVLGASISSCSSLKSIEQSNGSLANGLAYFMPKKDFLVVFNVVKDKPTKISLKTTAAYPDLSKRYVLRYSSNLIGKNTIDVKINDSGILSSAESETSSGFSDVLKGLATASGAIEGLALPTGNEEEVDCTSVGEYVFAFQSPGTYMRCKSVIEIQPMADSDWKLGANAHSLKAGVKYSGIFYRQNLPYKISVKSLGGQSSTYSVLFSPSFSDTLFLPISRTLFSNNKSTLEFIDGVPTKYSQDTEGELVAAAKLPADLIAAYFSAVGSVFKSFSATDKVEASALSDSVKLEIEKKKTADCLDALASDDDDKFTELKCGQ